MKETRHWTWHMAAGVVLLLLLGLHMVIMHLGSLVHWFSPHAGEAISIENSLSRDASLFFTITYVLLLAVALYHGLYGLRTILFELTLKPPIEKTVTALLLIVGVTLFVLGTWATVTVRGIALMRSGG